MSMQISKSDSHTASMSISTGGEMRSVSSSTMRTQSMQHAHVGMHEHDSRQPHMRNTDADGAQSLMRHGSAASKAEMLDGLGRHRWQRRPR
ncbi:hypothetical protein AWB67_01105 [Caballeronia terrestris]|uniref:Uncharacterized protein n=1 Tax=Caballeronia terrestris TaxID=1226301 RepID=A0A158G446_9BURK|nr:hypothetical protein [Caballeronia terrestris]SAL26836.1 hypothetical protein AWB67_01105 [Caballeronia terrestris]